MPKVSKIQSVSTKPKQAAPAEEERTEFFCCRCHRHHKKQKGNYPASQSPLYKGNGGYLATCNNCIDELFDHYKAALESETEAIRRICLKFDIYWNEEIYAMLNKASTSQSRVRAYISKTNLYKYIGKTFDDTLDEEYAESLLREEEKESVVVVDNAEIIPEVDGVELDPKIVEFWGTGFEPSFYLELDRKYKRWTSNLPKPLENGEEAIYKQVCILEATINRDSAAGKPIEKNVNALNNLLGSANLKPSQKKTEDASDAAFDSLPFGVGIRMYENSRPIPQPDPDLQDTDGIVKYISIWFLGHLCKMLGIKNAYCKMYEHELEKMRIENPELDEEDDETLFDDIFGGDT